MMNSILAIITALGSIGSIMSAVFEMREEFRMKSVERPNCASPKKPRKGPVRFIFIVLFLALFSVGFVISFVHPYEVFLPLMCIGLFFSVLSFVIYAVLAHQSFNDVTIMSPVVFWQVLFNKIPSRIKKVDQNAFRFLILQMDGSEETIAATKRIVDSYAGRTDFEIDVAVCDFGNCSLAISDDLCGMIAIIGEQGFENLEKISAFLDECGNRYLNLPIAYVRVSQSYFKLKYERISSGRLENCATQLIMRSFRRSSEWIRLSSHLHKTVLTVLVLLFVSVVSLLVMGRYNHVQRAGTMVDDYNDLKVSVMEGNSFDRQIDASDFESYVGNLNKLFFKYKDLLILDVKIWLRGGGLMNCVYSTGALQDNIPAKGGNSIIGGIADNPAIFVLWPGAGYPFHGDLAWDTRGRVDSRYNMEEHYISLVGRGEIRFAAPGENDNTVNDLAIFGYSYDGNLAVEIDFRADDLKDKEKCSFIQSRAFRDHVRLYYISVQSYIKALWEEEKVEVALNH